MRQKKCWFAISGILAVLVMALMLPIWTAAAKHEVQNPVMLPHNIHA